MAKRHRRLDEELVQGALLDDPGFLRQIVEGVLQHLLEAEITEHLGAALTSVPMPARDTTAATSRGSSKAGMAPSIFSCLRTGKGPSPRACSLATSETRRRLPWR